MVDLFILHVASAVVCAVTTDPADVFLAARPELVTLVLQMVQRVIKHFALDASELKADKGQDGAITLLERFGSTANLRPPT